MDRITSRPLIQLVEDDRLILATLGAALLRHGGYRVQTAESLAAARQALAAQRPALLVLDLRLPDGLGMELAEELRGTGPPVLFVTAFADQEFLDRAVALGAMGYLVKPVSPEQLLPMIATTLEASQRAAALRETERGLRTALDQDRITSIAIGVLMERRHIGHAMAFEQLRRAARNRRERIDTLAHTIVTNLDGIDALLPPGGAA